VQLCLSSSSLNKLHFLRHAVVPRSDFVISDTEIIRLANSLSTKQRLHHYAMHTSYRAP